MKKIIIDKKNYDCIINHCIRKLNCDYCNDETCEQQAFGVIVAYEEKDCFVVSKVIGLKRNYRYDSSVCYKLDNMINKFAIPGELNVSERAWAADPIELIQILSNLENNEKLLGMYHMHHDDSWFGNFPKDIPSKLDLELSKDNGLVSFIVYIGKSKKGIRAFYESKIEEEFELELGGK